MGKKDQNENIVLKINKDLENHRIETDVLQKLTDKGFKNFPKLIQNGTQNNKPFIILERLGQTLEFYMMIN